MRVCRQGGGRSRLLPCRSVAHQQIDSFVVGDAASRRSFILSGLGTCRFSFCRVRFFLPFLIFHCPFASGIACCLLCLLALHPTARSRQPHLIFVSAQGPTHPSIHPSVHPARYLPTFCTAHTNR
ncbi:hypothetical protein BKA80DRAFT_283582 [Phyllosticta citrichinensis]